MDSTIEGLRAEGFVGFERLDRVDLDEVPDVGGLYVVVREATSEPAYLPSNPAGRYKGRDPSIPLARIRDRWVDGQNLLYVGRSKHLRRRLELFRRFRDGEPVGHWGGRLVWQLADSDSLLVAWLPTGEQDPDPARATLVAGFVEAHGRPPFANLQRSRSRLPSENDGRITPVAIEPQLMFTGDAAEAMKLYTSVFGGSVVESVTRGPGRNAPVAFATFRLGTARFRCIDSSFNHEFGFTPSISLAVDCRTAEEVESVVASLGEGGQVLMPLATYPFNERYAWIADRFGVSWQVGVAPAS